MFETKHHWLPVILAFFLPLSFLITYSIAVANEHVTPAFPYISDTGTHPPESCVFGQLLNIGAVVCLGIMYVRYQHVLTLFEDQPRYGTVIKINKAGLGTGVLVNLGVSIVGNFQETNVIQVHLVGAFLAFAIGFIYCLLQLVISYKIAGGPVEMPGNTPCIRKFRLILCILDCILLLVLGVFAPVANSKGPGEGISKQKWSEGHPGYAEHIVATASEWMVAILSVTYFATFYTEFKHFRVKPPAVVFYNQDGSQNKTGSGGIGVSVISGPT